MFKWVVHMKMTRYTVYIHNWYMYTCKVITFVLQQVEGVGRLLGEMLKTDRVNVRCSSTSTT